MKELLTEAFVVGILTVIVGCIMNNMVTDLVLLLFITGVIIHLLCEYTGVNKWYCKNSVACKKN